MIIQKNQSNFFEREPLISIVELRTWVLVGLLFAHSALIPVAAESRSSPTVTHAVDRQDWHSNETIEVTTFISNSPYNALYTIQWSVFGSGTTPLLQGQQTFQTSGSSDSTVFDIHGFYMGDRFYSIEIEVLDSVGSLVETTEIALFLLAQTLTPQYSDLLVFGDSLSDMGNARSTLNVPDVPPYWQGRFSNGPVWIEHVGDRIGLSTSIGTGSSTGDNRAFGGSQTGAGYSYVVLPNVGTQISAYLANVQSTIPSGSIVALWAGGNDFLYGSANSNVIITNMEVHIRQLSTAGATEFIIPNLPPLELTPEILSRSQAQQSTIRSEVISYNQKLASLVGNLSAELSLTIHMVDAWSIFHEIVQNEDHLGFTDTQSAACRGGASLLPLPICNSGDPIAPNVDEYLFFDKAHPTRVMHQTIGDIAIEAIGEMDIDGDGVSDTTDICPWTRNSSVDSVGCSWEQRDGDEDGVPNGDDLCPNTDAGDNSVDTSGCADNQRDSDQDGLVDSIDPCPNGPSGPDYDLDGCANSVDSDDDNDGHEDTVDDCPRGVIGLHSDDLDQDGCNDSEDEDVDGDGLSDSDEDNVGSDYRDPDSDDDGVLDGADAFPLDSEEWSDIDGDGCGDNGDQFPEDPTECRDRDGDGVGDVSDAFPADSTEWLDSDDDGFGDNSDICPNQAGDAIEPLGCPDLDGDGYGDSVDVFPTDSNEWNDTDSDGVGDNSDIFPDDPSDWEDSDGDNYGDNSDVFPFDSSEWLDSDGDGYGDNQDTFPEDSKDWIDSDGDGCGDNSDLWPNNPQECADSDGDGFGDSMDVFPNDPLEWFDQDEDGIGDNFDIDPFNPELRTPEDLARQESERTVTYAMILIGLIVLISATIAAVFYIRMEAERPKDPSLLYDSVTEFSTPITAPSADMFGGRTSSAVTPDEDMNSEIL